MSLSIELRLLWVGWLAHSVHSVVLPGPLLASIFMLVIKRALGIISLLCSIWCIVCDFGSQRHSQHCVI